MKFKFKSIKVWVMIISIIIGGVLAHTVSGRDNFGKFVSFMTWIIPFYMMGNVASKFAKNKKRRRE